MSESTAITVSAASTAEPLAVAVWAQYAKERYDASERRIAEFRGWARQLVAAIAVVVGLEAALLSQLGKVGEVHPLPLAACLLVLLLGAVWQIVLLGRAVRSGYIGHGLLGPERPVALADYVTTELETRRITGAYYAKAAEDSHELAETVVGEISALARGFVATLWLLFAAMVLTGGMVGVSSLARKTMADTPNSSGTAPSQPTAPAAAPAAAPSSPVVPVQSPLLATPTPGATETRGHQPGVVKLTATPTVGQRVTEGHQGK